jgi:hypothetical protein
LRPDAERVIDARWRILRYCGDATDLTVGEAVAKTYI